MTPEVPDGEMDATFQARGSTTPPVDDQQHEKGCDSLVEFFRQFRLKQEKVLFEKTNHTAWTFYIADVSSDTFNQVFHSQTIDRELLEISKTFPPVPPLREFSSAVLGGSALLSLCSLMKDHSGEQTELIQRIALRIVALCGGKGENFMARLERKIAAVCGSPQISDFGQKVLAGHFVIKPKRLFQAVLATIRQESPEFFDAQKYRKIVLKVWSEHALAKPLDDGDLFASGQTYLERR